MSTLVTGKLQRQRYEMKYIIPESVALAVRDFVSPYMDLDPYGATLPDNSYPVHSLYLDSDDLALYQNTINGDRNRFKLRLRFYENRPGAPVYCEIKRRDDNTISKERGAILREAVDTVVSGQLPDASMMATEDPRHLSGVQYFVREVNRYKAKPKAHVAYVREAWLSRGSNSARVTMDRRVRICPDTTTRLDPEMKDPVSVFGDSVVLELKFTGRFPNWFAELVRVFGLGQTSAAKYVDGVVAMEEVELFSIGSPDFRHTKSRAVSRKSRQKKAASTFENTRYLSEDRE